MKLTTFIRQQYSYFREDFWLWRFKWFIFTLCVWFVENIEDNYFKPMKWRKYEVEQLVRMEKWRLEEAMREHHRLIWENDELKKQVSKLKNELSDYDDNNKKH